LPIATVAIPQATRHNFLHWVNGVFRSLPASPSLVITFWKDVASVKLNVERKPASLVVLDITADEDEFAEAMTKAFRKVSRDVQVPGFRKGKAPRNVIERMYGRDVFLREAADEVMDKLYRQALEQEDITPVGEPSVEINDLEPVNFVVTVPVFPSISLNDYSSTRVDPVDADVSDEDVEEVLDRLRKSRGEWVDPSEERTPREGDQVTVDYEVMDGETAFQEPIEDAVFVLGETNLLASLREKLEEMNVGDTGTFDLAFAEDDDTADPSIRGKSLSYKVTLKKIQERKLPELDDQFAQDVNEAGTLEELRQQIRDDVHSGRTNEARTEVLNKVIDGMASQADIDAPDVMVDEEVEHQLNHLKEDLERSNTPWNGYLRLQNKAEEDIKAELRPEAARRLRNSLFLQEVAKQEQVEVTDEDIDAEIASVTGSLPGAEGEGEESTAARMAQFYQSDYFRNMLKNQLFERKLTDRLIEIATEGKGAVINGYVAAEPVADIEVAVEDTASSETVSDNADGIVDADFTVADSVPEATTLAADAEAEEAAPEESTEEAPATNGYANSVPGNDSTTAPDGFPIKGNASSMIYHVPGGHSYDATIAEYYFATEEDAQAAGFRAARR
jgi:trigger factor